MSCKQHCDCDTSLTKQERILLRTFAAYTRAPFATPWAAVVCRLVRLVVVVSRALSAVASCELDAAAWRGLGLASEVLAPIEFRSDRSRPLLRLGDERVLPHGTLEVDFRDQRRGFLRLGGHTIKRREGFVETSAAAP